MFQHFKLFIPFYRCSKIVNWQQTLVLCQNKVVEILTILRTRDKQMANGEKFRRKKNRSLDQRCKPNSQLRAGALWRAKRKKKTKK